MILFGDGEGTATEGAGQQRDSPTVRTTDSSIGQPHRPNLLLVETYRVAVIPQLFIIWTANCRPMPLWKYTARECLILAVGGGRVIRTGGVTGISSKGVGKNSGRKLIGRISYIILLDVYVIVTES